MARRFVYPLAAWALVVVLTTVAGVSEGLHLLPGMGHGVMVGGQVVMLGDCGPKSGCGSPIPACCFVEGGKETTQFLDEDDCPICHFLGMKLVAAASGAMLLLEIPLPWSVVDPFDAWALDARVYQARAPPQI